ncbi:MAG: DNA mismatch repair endonuclease MutL [Planctomycetota bacterium]
MNRIKVLSQLLADKIAAGEVIERPASVVKELIENSLDAGARSIEVYVEEGGKRVIRITDDGRGILADDLPLVFKQHSTSKIDTEEDLFAVRTFGFRGEALASIGAIGQVRLVSRTVDRTEAYEITASGGRVSEPKPAAGAPGTSITVENIFFNTPARRRFLKSPPVELGHITDAVTRFALSHPEVRFLLKHQDKQLINLPATDDLMERIRQFFGNDTAGQLEYIEYRSEDLDIRAYMSRPEYTRPNSKYQFYYVNRRYIRDRVISRAIGQSYFSLIPSGQYPFVVLFIDIDQSQVDVNAHPTKIEVRFRNAWQLHDRIISTIRGKLVGETRTELLPPVGQITQINNLKQGDAIPQELAQNETMKAMMDFFGGKETGQSTGQPVSQSNETFPDRPTGGLADWPTGRPSFIQIHNSYIIMEVSDGMVIIDQHALHERLLYTAFMEQFSTGSVLKQRLLLTQSIELTYKQFLLVREAAEYLKDIGLEVEEFGRNTVRILAVPALLTKIDMAEFIKSLLDELADDDISKSDRRKVLDKMVKMMACKAAIKAGDPMSGQEIKALLDLAEKSGYKATCPHGRPAIYKFSKAQIGKFFKR